MVSDKLLVILGPTAVGKTALSLEVSQRFPSEIISADSRLFYKGMDIGTAKPSLSEMAVAPHHFIDICTPDQRVTLGEYQRKAYETIDLIHSRGSLPIVVGGTGQYVQALVEGWGIPEVAPDYALRAELEQIESVALHERLEVVDPVSAQEIHPNNKRRIIRALEISIVSGRPKSELTKKTPPPYDILMLGLSCDREKLYERIDLRVDKMIEADLVAECQALLDAGYTTDLPAMSGIGYQQLWPYLDGETTLVEAIERIKFETHRFVRHQNTWFQRDDRVYWYDIHADDYPNSALQAIEDWLQNLPLNT